MPGGYLKLLQPINYRTGNVSFIRIRFRSIEEKMKNLPLLLLLLLLLLVSNGVVESLRTQQLMKDNGAYLTQEEKWFTQTLDHFSPTVHFSLYGFRYCFLIKGRTFSLFGLGFGFFFS